MIEFVSDKFITFLGVFLDDESVSYYLVESRNHLSKSNSYLTESSSKLINLAVIYQKSSENIAVI
jgi:hypothetical protein